jgi:hypothetical protein
LSTQRWTANKSGGNVTEALRDLVQAGRVQGERFPKPTLGALQRQLRRARYHVFQFIGHGGFDPKLKAESSLLSRRIAVRT